MIFMVLILSSVGNLRAIKPHFGWELRQGIHNRTADPHAR